MSELLCKCGGLFVPTRDSITVQAGGALASQEWVDEHCNRCGSTLEEAATTDPCRRCGRHPGVLGGLCVHCEHILADAAEAARDDYEYDHGEDD